MVGGVLIAFVVNLALFMSAFKLLTAADVGWREYLPGVIVAAILWQLLQHLGGYYVDHGLKQQALYGIFALVLGLLAWLYLGAQLVIFAAEVNVVRVAQAVAAQLLLRAAARRRQARADVLGRDRGARTSRRTSR